jgi:hypothetical protein
VSVLLVSFSEEVRLVNFWIQRVLKISRIFMALQPVRFGDWHRTVLWVSDAKWHCSECYRSLQPRCILWFEGNLSW